MFEDSNYPQKLRALRQPPQQLYCVGNMELLTHNTVAVIGSVSPTPRSALITRSLVKILVTLQNIAVVSGFAYGTDIIAHLSTEGRTIIVCSTPLRKECMYPPEHRKYIDILLEMGALFVSEYEDDAPTNDQNAVNKRRLVERDRIQAGLSEIIVPIIFQEDSGTMHTVQYGLELGLQMFQIHPGTKELSSNFDLYTGNVWLAQEKNVFLQPTQTVLEQIATFPFSTTQEHQVL